MQQPFTFKGSWWTYALAPIEGAKMPSHRFTMSSPDSVPPMPSMQLCAMPDKDWTRLAAGWLGLSVDEANMLRQRRVLQQKGEGQ